MCGGWFDLNNAVTCSSSAVIGRVIFSTASSAPVNCTIMTNCNLLHLQGDSQSVHP
jgi:hypothetical protein